MERKEMKYLTLMTEEPETLLYVLAKVGGWQNMQFGAGFRLLPFFRFNEVEIFTFASTNSSVSCQHEAIG